MREGEGWRGEGVGEEEGGGAGVRTQGHVVWDGFLT